MTNSHSKTLSFSPLNCKKIQANFKGGSVTSDGGLLLLREVDKEIGLTKQLAQAIKDKRHPLLSPIFSAVGQDFMRASYIVNDNACITVNGW